MTGCLVTARPWQLTEYYWAAHWMLVHNESRWPLGLELTATPGH